MERVLGYFYYALNEYDIPETLPQWQALIKCISLLMFTHDKIY